MSISFQTVPSIESGLGKISVLPEVCNRLNIKKPIIVTDQGLFQIGLVEKLKKTLEKNNIQTYVYKDVLADPPEHNIFDAVKLFDDFGADGVIGFGGGSSMDVAKAVSEVKAGKIDFKVDKTGIVHAPIGKASFSADKIKDNAMELLTTLNKLKPTAAKGVYMKSIFMSSTMSPSIAIDVKFA